MPPTETTTSLAADPVDDLPAAYWRILPLHAISETHGLPGLRHRLALEITDLPPEDQAVLGRAWTLAERLHRDDRRSREPYLHHILRVAIRVMSHFRVRDRDVIAAALLHDAVEDHAAELAASMGGDPTDAALAVLDRQFGPRVARLVASVTNPVYDPRGDRNEHYRLHLVESLTWDPWARVIKLSDFLDNGLGVIYSTAAKARKSAAKYAPLVPDLLELVNLPDTPLDEAVKTHICGQLDQARRRFAAILHG